MDDFLEKMDAMRMNLELAIHDIETMGGKHCKSFVSPRQVNTKAFKL